MKSEKQSILEHYAEQAEMALAGPGLKRSLVSLQRAACSPFPSGKEGPIAYVFSDVQLERFASLVAAAQREVSAHAIEEFKTWEIWRSDAAAVVRETELP